MSLRSGIAVKIPANKTSIPPRIEIPIAVWRVSCAFLKSLAPTFFPIITEAPSEMPINIVTNRFITGPVAPTAASAW